MRIVRLLVPKWVLVENVPGLLWSNKGRDMLIVLQELADSGYGWAYRVLDSRYFGVPQRRRRVYIVGFLGAVPPPEILFEPAGNKRDVPKDDEASSISKCINAKGSRRRDSSVETYIAKTIDTCKSNNASAERRNYIASTITKNKGIHNARNDTLVTRCVNTNRRGGSCAAQETYIAESYAGGKRETAGPAQGLDTARSVVIGNGMTVPVVRWIGERIKKYEKINRDKGMVGQE